MTVCKECYLVHLDSMRGHPRTWMCTRFRQNAVDPVSGEQMPPFHKCHDVLRITMFDGKCTEFEEARELSDGEET
jgi:hypothetical protein